jgi:hypothetical protein
MAEMQVRIDGAASTAAPIKITDNAGSVINIALPDPNLGAMMLVTTGQLVASTTLNAVTTNATGTTMDCGAAHANVTVVGVGTATLTGTITIEGSVDGTTWVSTGTTVALTAAATVTATSSAKAFRYYRASLSGAGGSGTLTAKLMAS